MWLFQTIVSTGIPYLACDQKPDALYITAPSRIEQTTTAKFYRDGAGRVRREQTILGLAALAAGTRQGDPSGDSQTLITIDPDPDRHEQYRFYMDRYTELYPQVKDVMHQVARHVGGGPDA